MNRNSGRTWINFKELREKLDFEKVLRFYKVAVNRKGSQHQGVCPLPSHSGNPMAHSFSANLDRGIFQCFSCGAKGNALEFAALMDGVDVNDGNALRKVAVRLRDAFLPRATGEEKKVPVVSVPAERTMPLVLTNQPLDFELKTLEHQHESLMGRGFTLAVTHRLGVGFCSRGMLKDRIVIPLHDREGRLVGYVGRVVDDRSVCEGNPLYLYPARRERGGMILDFRKDLLLYNVNRIKGQVRDLIVVSDFASVWWLVQQGFPDVVATMGEACSPEQAEQIVATVMPGGSVWFLSSGTEEDWAQSLFRLVAPHRFVRWARIEGGKEPTDLSVQGLKTIFASDP